MHWARFHLGDSMVNGEEVLSTKVRKDMQKPTVELKGSSLGDAIGIGWFLHDIKGLNSFIFSMGANST